jgi:hypothetical protein
MLGGALAILIGWSHRMLAREAADLGAKLRRSDALGRYAQSDRGEPAPHDEPIVKAIG